MVQSVLAVANVGKVNRDMDRDNGSSSGRNGSESGTTFSKVLQKEVEERKANSLGFKTTTYGADRRIHSFEYQPREYYY